MCQVIFLGSVEPLPESDALELRHVAGPGLTDPTWADIRAALPEARYLYALVGCQCHFRYYPEEEIAPAPDADQPVDKEAADRNRWYFRSRNAFVARTADFLDAHVSRTRIWLVWKWEGEPLGPACARWTRTPGYFRQPDFTMPQYEGIITILPD